MYIVVCTACFRTNGHIVSKSYTLSAGGVSVGFNNGQSLQLLSLPFKATDSFLMG